MFPQTSFLAAALRPMPGLDAMDDLAIRAGHLPARTLILPLAPAARRDGNPSRPAARHAAARREQKPLAGLPLFDTFLDRHAALDSARDRGADPIAALAAQVIATAILGADRLRADRRSVKAIVIDSPVGPTPLEDIEPVAQPFTNGQVGPMPLATVEEMAATIAEAPVVAAPVAPKAKRPPGPVFWTNAKDAELTDLWVRNAHHKLIAVLIGSSPSAVASRAHRLNLPQRLRSVLIATFDGMPAATAETQAFVAAGPTVLETPAEAAAAAAAEKAPKAAKAPAEKIWGRKTKTAKLRKCLATGVMFWSSHPGERICAAAKETQSYKQAAALAKAWI